MRFGTTLDGRLREIVILRVAHLNGATYVFKQHVPELALAEGLSMAECEAITDWPRSDLFSARERAALAYADAMTRDIAVPDAVFAALKDHFSERQMVELTVLVGDYIFMHSMSMALADPHVRPSGSLNQFSTVR